MLKSFPSKEHEDVVEMQVKCVPSHLYPAKGETEETMLDRFRSDDFLDVEFHSRSGKLILNDLGVHTPRRRFETVVISGPEIYNGGDGSDGVGEGVFRGFVYPAIEKPPDCNRARPMRIQGMAFMLTIWEMVWEYLSEYSRLHPPNCYQFLNYVGVLNCYMGDHRDNYTDGNISNLISGGSPIQRKPRKGQKNSQVDGSSVVIFSKGNRPMEIVFSYGATPDHLGDKRDDYVTSISYQMKCGDGWITVLDPIDDLLMRHRLQWVVKCEVGEYPAMNQSYRFAWVIRWLGETADFFVNTCGMRLSAAMEEHYKNVDKVDDKYPHLIRGIFT